MKNRMLLVGEIVQINPEMKVFGGCMMTVTEPKPWGAQGYIKSAGVDGLQYMRVKFKDMKRTGGIAPWFGETDS